MIADMQDLRPGDRVMLPPYLGHTIATVMFTYLPLPHDLEHDGPFLLGGQRMAVVEAVGHDGRPRLVMVEWRDLRPIPNTSGPPG